MLKTSRAAEHVPFVNTERDCGILRSVFADSEFVRVPLRGCKDLVAKLPAGPKIWVDAGIDGLDRWPVEDKYKQYLEAFSDSDRVADPVFREKPDAAAVRRFVNCVLDACATVRPTWLSIPQLPMTADSTRNRINRELASATRQWAANSRFAGRLVLPVVFTHQSQVNLKTARTPKVTLVTQCYNLAGAHGAWVVDSSLMDQEGSRPLEQTRFPGLINLHQELLGCLPTDAFVIAGPYWGMNMVLWARGLIRYPAMGLGNYYQYHLPGSRLQQGKSRVALGSLKRWVVVSQSFQAWLTAALKVIPASDPAHLEFAELLTRFSTLLRGTNREQVARVYKAWFGSLVAVPAAGRALAMYQQLSSAYVLGKSLPELPKDEGSARRPERVAQQLMLACL